MKNKKGPAARKREGPPREAEAKRQPNAKKIKKKNQDLLFKFDKDYPGLTFDEAGGILAFIRWLETKGYHIIDGRTVFCFPFSRMVRFKDLK